MRPIPLFRLITQRYKIDIIIIVTACLAVAALGVFAHGAVKPYTRTVAWVAPLAFAVALFLVLAGIGIKATSGVSAFLRRVFFDLAIAALVIPATLLKVEIMYAPVAWLSHEGTAQVAARIATDDDIDRFRAWSRLVSMSREDKEAVARAVSPLLVGENVAARHSAQLSFDVALRRHILCGLVELTPDLKRYFQAGGPHVNGAQVAPEATPTEAERSTRAAAFARQFVLDNVGSIHKAIEPEARAVLPPGALAALVLALATESTIGQPILHYLADGDSEPELQELARAALKLTVPEPTT